MTLFAEYNSPYLFAIAFVSYRRAGDDFSDFLATSSSGALDAHLSIIMTPCHLRPYGPGASLSEYWTRSRPSSSVYWPVISASPVSSSSMADHALASAAQQSAAGLSIVLSVFAVHYSGKILAPPRYPEMKSPPSGKSEFDGAWRLLPATPPSPVHLAKGKKFTG